MAATRVPRNADFRSPLIAATHFQLAATVGIVDIGQSCDLELLILDAHALLLVREGDDLSVIAVGDEGGGARAGPVLVKKTRQHVHGDVGRGAAEEVDTMEERNP